MGRAVQIPVEVRMRSYKLRARMYRMEGMMRQSTSQGAYELAPCSAAATTAAATANATSARSAIR